MRARSPLALALTLTALLATVSPAQADDAWRARHVLERLGYGPTPGAVGQVQAMGVERYIATQLSPDALPLPPALADRLAGLTTLKQDPSALVRDFMPPKGQKKGPETRSRRREPLVEAAEARLARAIESPRQLEAVMTEFWFNHFNVFAGKGRVGLWVGAYEEQAIRPRALGRFRDLLGAVAHHPAMLFYLDNWRNSAPKAGKGRQGLNENYARELLELHTLGVDGGYTQSDVTTLARVLTGWGFRRPGQQDFSFHFAPARHDGSPKRLLGRDLTARGAAEVEQALDRLAAHPATARHLSRKLARAFVADEPPAALVDRMAARYTATDGDLRAVLATCFASPEFWAPAHVGAKYKTPYRYVVSAMRATGAGLDEPRPVLQALRRLGMPLYGCVTPDGYADRRSAWLSPQGMAGRIGLATAFGLGRGPWGADDGPPDADALEATLAWAPSEATRQALEAARPGMRAALVLGSPEFMHH